MATEAETRAVSEWMSSVDDVDEAEVLLAAALDEAQGDVMEALELAKVAYGNS